MHIDELEPDWRDKAHNREVAHWKHKFRYTVKLCKAIRAHFDYIEQISESLAKEDIWHASMLWYELDEETQNLLITAPTFGGPFTTKERAQIVELWKDETKIQDSAD